MPFDYVEFIPETDLGIFQVSGKKSIQYMNRLFNPSPINTGGGFPKYWTTTYNRKSNDFYNKINLVKGIHTFENSLWKYHHGTNACLFDLQQAYEALESVSIDFDSDALQFGVKHIEIGVYFLLKEVSIQQLRMKYRGTTFDPMKRRRSREVYGWKLSLRQFEIKFYDITKKQRLAKEEITAMPGSLRFEIKYYDKRLLQQKGIGKVYDLFDQNSQIYQHWKNVVEQIEFKYFPNLPSDVKTSDLKNIFLKHSDAYPEFERIVKQKKSGPSDLARMRKSIERNLVHLSPKVDFKSLLLDALNSSLLLS